MSVCFLPLVQTMHCFWPLFVIPFVGIGYYHHISSDFFFSYFRFVYQSIIVVHWQDIYLQPPCWASVKCSKWNVLLPLDCINEERRLIVSLSLSSFTNCTLFLEKQHLAKWFFPPHFWHSFPKATHCFSECLSLYLLQFPLSYLDLVSFFFTFVVALGFVHCTASTSTVSFSLLKIFICAFALMIGKF